MKEILSFFRSFFFAPLRAMLIDVNTTQNTPGLGQVFQRNQVISASSSEVLRQTLYDSLLYPLLGLQNMQFFATGIGQGVTSAPGSTVGQTKSIQDTNMAQGGSLSSGLAYNIESISIYFFPGSSAVANTFTPVLFGTADTDALSTVTVNALNDIKKFYEAGVFNLHILQKDYLTEALLRKFPPQNYMRLEGALATGAVDTTPDTILQTFNAYPCGNAYVLSPLEISLQPAVTFSAELKWGSNYATASALNGRVMVEFGGMLLRASQ